MTACSTGRAPQRDADAVDREAVDEVGGAVQRIDDPDVVGALLAMLAAGFLGQMPWSG
jgi:hypothetical protein